MKKVLEAGEGGMLMLHHALWLSTVRMMMMMSCLGTLLRGGPVVVWSSVVRRPSSSVVVRRHRFWWFWVSIWSLCHSCSLVSLDPFLPLCPLSIGG